MITYLKNLMTDQGMFIGFARAVLMAIAMTFATGDWTFLDPGTQNILAVCAAFASSFIRSSVNGKTATLNGDDASG